MMIENFDKNLQGCSQLTDGMAAQKQFNA